MGRYLKNTAEFFIAGIIALLLAITFMIPTGLDPIKTLQSVFLGSFRDALQVMNLIKYCTIFLLTSLSVLIPYQARIWNIGGEGQLYMGALGATWISVVLGQYGNVALLYLTAMLVGSLWAGLAGVLKAKFNADEIVTTIFLNFIALYIVSWSVSNAPGTLRDATQKWNQSWPIPQWETIDFYYGTAMTLVLIFLTYFVLYRTRIGYSIRALGGNPKAADYANFGKTKITILSLMAGGAMAGLAGAFILTSIFNVLLLGLSANYGYLGIGAAAMVNFDTILLIPSSILFSMFFMGMKTMQIQMGASETIIPVLIGLTILISMIRGNETVRKRLAKIVTWMRIPKRKQESWST